MNGDGNGVNGVVVSFKLPPELLDRLDRYARLVGKRRSLIIKRAINLYLAEPEEYLEYATRRVKVYGYRYKWGCK